MPKSMKLKKRDPSIDRTIFESISQAYIKPYNSTSLFVSITPLCILSPHEEQTLAYIIVSKILYTNVHNTIGTLIYCSKRTCEVIYLHVYGKQNQKSIVY